ncbi:MAG: hypothetical protein J0I48_22480 [Devosia sp.]|uniref:capsid assembly protein n=1 Tax=Devosia sp. 66-22 TaxID=1895753 RepID=UPI00092BD349|nr:hypothetical protein [Devosia sp. 66-22]MBN9348932.1 hypothetical protein [Devosia sp.]OJX54724.1 MAG: hypothetical protein BGO81_16525 [Devosia sp. 66-22]
MTDTTSNATEVPAPEGHDAAMLAKAEAANAAPVASGTPQVPQRPDNVPEKFWDATKGEVRTDELLKSYSELEKGKPTAASETPAPGDPNAAREAATAAGLDFDAIVAEYTKNGSLSTETRAAIVAKGITEQTLNDYIAGQEAIAAGIRTDVFSTVGGEEAYTSMVAWAGKGGLTPAEVASFDKVMDSGDVGQIKLAVAGLHAKFTAAGGTEPKLLGGGSEPDGGDVFTSRAQVTSAMRDPRYAKDPAYRAEVQAKLGRSNVN